MSPLPNCVACVAVAAIEATGVAASMLIDAKPPKTRAAAADSAVRRRIFRDLCITDSLR
jgi:hypothetical protein